MFSLLLKDLISDFYLIRFIPESTRNHAGTDETIPLLPAAQTWAHTVPQNVKREEKSENEDRTSDPLPANPNLYRAAIKADFNRKAAQVCYIHNTITYSGVHRGYLPPSVAGSFQICKICFFSYGEVF